MDQAKALGIGLLSANYLGDYDLLVIGGGVCDLAADVRDLYRATAEIAYREHALDGFRNLDRFEFSVWESTASSRNESPEKVASLPLSPSNNVARWPPGPTKATVRFSANG